MPAQVHKTSIHGNTSNPLPACETTRQLSPLGNTIALDALQAAQLRDAAGWTVWAVCGKVWLTQDGDGRDIILEAGQSFSLENNLPAVLSPLGQARASVRLDPTNRTKSSSPLAAHPSDSLTIA